MSRAYYRGPASLVPPAVAYWQRLAWEAEEAARRAQVAARDASSRALHRAQHEQNKRDTAQHEAAHAVVAFCVDVPVDEIRVDPDGGGEMQMASGYSHRTRENLMVKLAALAYMRGQGKPMERAWASAE